MRLSKILITHRGWHCEMSGKIAWQPIMSAISSVILFYQLPCEEILAKDWSFIEDNLTKCSETDTSWNSKERMGGCRQGTLGNFPRVPVGGEIAQISSWLAIILLVCPIECNSRLNLANLPWTICWWYNQSFYEFLPHLQKLVYQVLRSRVSVQLAGV